MNLLQKVIGGLFIFSFMVLYGIFTWSLIVYQYYYWFAMPLVPQLPHINLHEAIAIGFLLNLFKTHSSLCIKDDYRDKEVEYCIMFIAPWLLLIVGYIFRLSY